MITRIRLGRMVSTKRKRGAQGTLQDGPTTTHGNTARFEVRQVVADSGMYGYACHGSSPLSWLGS